MRRDGRQSRRCPGRPWGLGPALSALLWIALAPPAALAEGGDETLAACVERASQAVVRDGAKPYGEPIGDFMLSGEHRNYEYALPQDGCFGFFAVGHRQVQHLGLHVYAPNGRLLTRDPRRDAQAYVRVCGKGGRRFIVELRMFDGNGEFQLLPLWDAPRRLTATRQVMRSCMHAGAPRPAPVDVGPEPGGPPIDAELVSMARRLSDLGYRLEGGILVGGLPERRREARRVLLDGDRCYALAAVGDSDVEDIDLRLLQVAEPSGVIAADVTRRRDAVVKVCPGQTGIYVLDVRMYRGGGNYLVQSFALIEPGIERPEGVEGETRIPFAEIATRFSERGMRTEPVGWGLLRPRESQSVPLPVKAGICYGVGAIATSEFKGADLDMTLIDESGATQAAEIGPNSHPVVFHCAERDGLLRAVVRGHDLRQPGRYLLLRGRDVLSEANP
ncbi:MAG: hypothetical protein OEZ06_22820 [Myxococcales bacterium]|nr:hypothetical protein [Myxococcales bacterium]